MQCMEGDAVLRGGRGGERRGGDEIKFWILFSEKIFHVGTAAPKYVKEMGLPFALSFLTGRM